MADTETPPFSRLFVLGDKEITDEEYEEEFSKFGPIQYIKRVRDKNTGEPKGMIINIDMVTASIIPFFNYSYCKFSILQVSCISKW